MKFTYRAYRELLRLLREREYVVEDYHTWQRSPRCVILRHDVDNSLEQAVRMAELEAEEGVKSTYFVLLRTDFYNPASKAGCERIRRILSMGHEVGLHFDEAAYAPGAADVCGLILKEAEILSSICDYPITTVSMHRPSGATLEANLEIPGMVNSYGQTFFHDFKYLSDSRRRWREPVLDRVCSGEYDRLHILTHPFWYHDEEETIEESVGSFIRAANRERYSQMMDNITDLASILSAEEV